MPKNRVADILAGRTTASGRKINPANAGMTDYEFQNLKALGLKQLPNGKVIVDNDAHYEPPASFK